MSLKEMCRACLCSDQIMCSLLESLVPKCDSPPNSVLGTWKIFTEMLIAAEHSLPDKICTDCIVEVQRTYSFILKCERSENILRTMKNPEKSMNGLHTVSILREYEPSINTKFENNTYPHRNILNIKTENIECNNVINEKDTQGAYFEVIHENFDDIIDPWSQHALKVQYENYNLEIELTDQPMNDIAKDPVAPMQDIKQEPELEICSEKGEFDEIESEDQSSIEIIVCLGCHYECRLMESMEKHMMDIHMEGRMCKLCKREFECTTSEHCPKHVFKSSNHLISRATCERDKRQFKCEICQKTFKRKAALMNHFERHPGQRLFKCKICSTTFQHETALKGHLRRHPIERPFKCEICSKSFQRKDLLEGHSRQHTKEREYKCEKCSTTFTNKGSLTIHLKHHTEERPFKCEICPRAFMLKSSLSNHLRYHSGERHFKCEICPKTFLGKHGLTNHLRYHTGERPFKCDICTKTFQRKEILTAHLRQHTGERPFQCENCSRSFINKSSLANHLKYHSGERLYSCEKCSKTFILKSSLTNHYRQHTGERPYKCERCSKTFILANNFKNHLACHS